MPQEQAPGPGHQEELDASPRDSRTPSDLGLEVGNSESKGTVSSPPFTLKPTSPPFSNTDFLSALSYWPKTQEQLGMAQNLQGTFSSH